ncbi:MAG: hypothetical protein H0Z33_16155 [Bacillaceae bacterium]|nr:hypothetical protein [Bacillaceae bacterium]
MSFFQGSNLFSGKLNKLRTMALGVVFVGIIIMYLGYAGYAGFLGGLFQGSGIFMSIMMVIGLLLTVSSFLLYFWVGMLSTRAVQVECPTCRKPTKMLGTTDDCMFCGQRLSFDPKYASHSQDSQPQS